MSAPIPNSYTTYVRQCESSLAECRRCLATLAPKTACYDALRQCISALDTAVEMMQSNSKFTSRYLVDCAEVCQHASDCCEACNDDNCRRCARVLRSCIMVCRRASSVGMEFGFVSNF